MKNDKLLEVLSRKLEKEADTTPEAIMRDKLNEYKKALQNNLVGYSMEDVSNAIKGLIAPNKKAWIAGWSDNKYKMQDGTIEFVEFYISLTEPFAVIPTYDVSVTALSFVEDRGETYQSQLALTYCSYDVNRNEMYESSNTIDMLIDTLNSKVQDMKSRAVEEIKI